MEGKGGQGKKGAISAYQKGPGIVRPGRKKRVRAFQKKLGGKKDPRLGHIVGLKKLEREFRKFRKIQ